MDNDNCDCRASSSGFVFCHLHAAAPEMLEALKSAAACQSINSVRGLLLAAIAKAEGK